MQNLLNTFAILVTIVYGLGFIVNTVNVIERALSAKTEVIQEPVDELEAPQTKVLLTTTVENTHQIVSPACKPYEQVTIAEMKNYIKERGLKEQLEAQMLLKLYKANKNAIYHGLKAL